MQTSFTDEKYRVVAPEAMHETFMSDSEEEGGKYRSCVSCHVNIIISQTLITQNSLNFTI